jgi:hypothetical protein
MCYISVDVACCTASWETYKQPDMTARVCKAEN